MQHDENIKGSSLYYVSHNNTIVLWGPFRTYEEAERRAIEELRSGLDVKYQVLRMVAEVYCPRPDIIVEKY